MIQVISSIRITFFDRDKKRALEMDIFTCPNTQSQSRLACKLHAFLNVDSLIHWFVDPVHRKQKE